MLYNISLICAWNYVHVFQARKEYPQIGIPKMFFFVRFNLLTDLKQLLSVLTKHYDGFAKNVLCGTDKAEFFILKNNIKE